MLHFDGFEHEPGRAGSCSKFPGPSAPRAEIKVDFGEGRSITTSTESLSPRCVRLTSDVRIARFDVTTMSWDRQGSCSSASCDRA